MVTRTPGLPSGDVDLGGVNLAQPARILVVDDDLHARDVAVRALRAAGYVTAACGTVPVALRVAARFRPDLVVLDMVIGGAAVGADLARRLLAESSPLLLFVASSGALDDKLAAFDAGADDYLVRPVAEEELLARVHALLRRGGRLSSVVTQVGRLVVDERAHRVVLAGREIELSPKDFALLTVLARHAGQVLSKARLLELVWGYDAVDETLVEVHMSTMRRRLGRDGARMVRTVRGVGYVLRDLGPPPPDAGAEPT
ncbi:MAG TPA: response regulator transcription factor [Acidimicrobiales bacterium]